MKTKITNRQGDVSLLSISKPTGLGQPVAQGRVTLALGEVSGHAHVIDGAVAEFRAADGRRILWIEAAADLRHVGAGGSLTGEHDTQTVRPGWYVVNPQVEYAPEDVRVVMD